jgi:hypothetical protein
MVQFFYSLTLAPILTMPPALTSLANENSKKWHLVRVFAKKYKVLIINNLNKR